MAAAQDMRIVLAVPGPRSLNYLPMDLIAHIGADRAEQAAIRLVPYGGGGAALEQVIRRNADFAVVGLPAAMWARAGGAPVVTVAAVGDQPVFVVLARTALRHEIHSVADLRGRTIGVASSSMAIKTTSQQLMELMLVQAGVPLSSVRITAAGQSWTEQSSVILSGAVDAIMGNEPFATRLHEGGHAFILASLTDPAVAQGLPGAGFLLASLHTRRDVIDQQPDKVARMVRILRRTLEWAAAHTPEEIAAASGASDPEEQRSLAQACRTYPRLFSPDGRFSARQLQETETFFRATAALSGDSTALAIETMVDSRWSGRKE